MIRHVPRFTGFLLRNLFFGRKMRKELERLESRVEKYKDLDLNKLSPNEILHALDELKPLVQQIAYFNIDGILGLVDQEAAGACPGKIERNIQNAAGRGKKAGRKLFIRGIEKDKRY